MQSKEIYALHIKIIFKLADYQQKSYDAKPYFTNLTIDMHLHRSANSPKTG
jgi:hypothetical protein